MKKLILLLFPLVLLASACAPAAPATPTPPHPLFEGLERPPLNQPIRITPMPVEEIKLQLPEGETPVLLVARDEQAFTGRIREVVELEIGRDLMAFELPTGELLRILYRLPKGMELPEGTRKGEVRVADFSTPVGADRQVLISDERTLVFAEVWQTSEKPLTVELNESLSLVQRQVDRRREQGGYTEAELQLFEMREPVATIPVGEVTEVETRVGMFQAFVEVSHLFTSDDPKLGQYPDRYILHVWIVRPE